MKTILITAMMFLSIFIYAENSAPQKEGTKNEKGLTPDSVVYKDATVAQNDAAWKNRLIPILSEKKSVHYTKDNLKVDSIQATGLFYNQILNKNKPVTVHYVSNLSFAWEPIIAGGILLLVFLFWGLFVRNNSTQSIVLVLILLIISGLSLIWFYFGADKENFTLITFSWIICSTSLVSILSMIVSDAVNAEKTARIILGGLIIILLFIFFYYIQPTSVFFFYLGSAGIVLASLIILLINYFTSARKKM